MPNLGEMDDQQNFSEYKQNYQWHENYSSNSDRPVVVRKATDLTAIRTEPAIPRRKKHPEVAYRSNHAVYQVDPAIAAERARSKEKAMANNRSRSADPNMGRKSLVVNPISDFEVPYLRSKQRANAEPNLKSSKALNTESSSTTGTAEHRIDAITEQPTATRSGKVTEYKAKFRPFSAYEYVDGNWKEPVITKVVMAQPSNDTTSWYQEVVDTRKKAEENKSRQRYSALESDHFEELYKRQVALWSQVSSRYMLSALSLASSQHTPKKQKPEKRPTTAPIANRRTSQSPQKSPQKKILSDASDGTRTRKVSPRPLHIKQPSPTAINASFHNAVLKQPMVHSTKNRPRSSSRSAHSSDTTSPVKSDGPSRPKSPKKPYSKSIAPVPAHIQPKSSGAPKTKKSTDDKKAGDSKKSNRPTTLAAATPKMKPSARENLPRTHSKPKQKTPVAAAGNGPNDSPSGKIWLKPEKKKESPVTVDNVAPTSDQPILDEQKPNDNTTTEKQTPNGNEQPNPLIADAVVNGVPSPRADSPPPLPEPGILPGGPVTLTHVRSPEEVTGMKSPDPETWTVPLRKSQPLNWTDGQIESPMSDSGRTNTPASHNSPHHQAQKPKPAITELPHHHNLIEENDSSVLPMPHSHSPKKSDQSIPSRPVTNAPRNPDEVLDKARSRLDEFWNTST